MMLISGMALASGRGHPMVDRAGQFSIETVLDQPWASPVRGPCLGSRCRSGVSVSVQKKNQSDQRRKVPTDRGGLVISSHHLLVVPCGRVRIEQPTCSPQTRENPAE